jgi:hypothetical protein
LARRLDDLQAQLRQGPCRDALDGDNFVVTANVGEDARWPLFGPEAAAAGVRSVLAICLVGGPTAVGLTLFSKERDAFVEPLDDVWLVASFARVVLGYVPASALTDDLLDFTPVGAATRAVMDTYALDAIAAFMVLLSAARRAEEPLYVVADQLTLAIRAGLFGRGTGRTHTDTSAVVTDSAGRPLTPGADGVTALTRGSLAGARAEELHRMRSERRPSAGGWQERMALARQRFKEAQERAQAASLAAMQRHLEAAHLHDRVAKTLAARGDVVGADRHRQAARLERKLAEESPVSEVDRPAAQRLDLDS